MTSKIKIGATRTPNHLINCSTKRLKNQVVNKLLLLSKVIPCLVLQGVRSKYDFKN